MLTKIAIAVVVLLVLIQLVPVSRINPPSPSTIQAPDDVLSVLKRSCFNCHSHETQWPWYSHVAPVSWLVAHDVNEGRGAMNFSNWAQYDAKERADHFKEIWDEVEDGGMPPWYYLLMHREARLSERDKQVLHDWVLSQGVSGGE
jgi:hypothetical protein